MKMDYEVSDSLKSSELLCKIKNLIFNPEDVFQIANEFREECAIPHISFIENESGTATVNHCIDVLQQCLSTTHDNTALFLPSEERDKVQDAIYILKNAFSKNFPNMKFYKFLCSPDIFSLELLWRLLESGLITMEIFLRECLGQARTLALFSRSLASLCLNKHSNEETKMAILQGILPSLVTCIFSKPTDTDASHEQNIHQVCKIILESLLQRLICGDAISTHHSSVEKNSINIVQILCDSPFIEAFSLQAFCTFILNYLLTHNPITKVSQAVSDQHKWSFKRSNLNFVSVIQKIITVLPPANVMTSLKRALESKEVNWKILLTIVSVFLICIKEASLLLQELIEELLREAFNKLELDNLISSFLIARQCSLEGPNFFLTYEDWFQKYFGDSEKSFISNSRTFKFLITFLTNIVPYEPVPCLKVHLFKPPYVPQKHKQVYNDYIALVKTRLHDLKINWDNSGIYVDGKSAENDESVETNRAENDVNRALQLYESTGKIPSSIYQASIFHKVYFNTQFLPFLLTPRPLPDVPDSKTKFIEDLNKLGKIPPTLYNSYKKECEVETFKLLEGVIMDENFDDDITEPYDQLLTSVSSFCRSIDTSSEPGTLCLLISQLSNSLQSMLEQPLESPQDIILSECLDNSLINSQVSTSLVEAFIACSKLTGCTYIGQKNSWDILFVSMISSYPVLHKPFFLNVWHQMKHFSNTESIALLLLRITELGDLFNKVLKDKSSEKISLCEAVFDNFKLNTFHLMSKFIQFSVAYLKFIISENNIGSTKIDQLIPSTLIKKFQFVAVRFCPELRGDISFDCDRSCEIDYDSILEIYKSQLIQNRLNDCKLTMKEWLSLEIEIQPEKDIFLLHESCTYLYWSVHCIYLPHPVEKGGCDGSVEKACTEIFSAFISMNENSSSFCRILLLLQELTLSLSSCETDELPWLLHEFKQKFGSPSFEAPAIELQYHLHAFFRIAQLLSPYLLFSNTVSSIPKQGLQFIQAAVNENLKALLVEDYSLSSYLTIYFWKGIVLLYRIEENRPSLENFLNGCPLLVSSMITHWNIVSPLLSHILSRTSQHLLSAVLSKIKSWMNMSFYSFLRCDDVPTKDKWIAGLILAQRMKLYSPAGSLSLSTPDPEVLSMAFHFAVAEITNQLVKNEHFSLGASNIFIELVKALLSEEHSKFLKPQYYNGTVLKEVLAPTVLYLHPAGILFVLLHPSLSTYHSTCNKSYASWLTAVLVNLKEFVLRVDDFYGKLYKAHIQTYNISDFYLAVKFVCDVQEIMSRTPASVLRLIPREVLHFYETVITRR